MYSLLDKEKKGVSEIVSESERLSERVSESE